MVKGVAVAAGAGVLMLAGCGRPDGQALQRLACEQVANSIDLQSVAQLDALRKALGVAPGVDPLQTCRDLGVTMQPTPQDVEAGKREGQGNGEEQSNGEEQGEP